MFQIVNSHDTGKQPEKKHWTDVLHDISNAVIPICIIF